jgi:hypothetical protein
MTDTPDRTADTDAPASDGDSRPQNKRPGLSARDLQENASQGQPLEAAPGSDADQANEVPHVG